MKRKKKTTGIVMELVWSSGPLAIYNDHKTKEHVLYENGESIFNAPTFDEVYSMSLRHRGLKA